MPYLSGTVLGAYDFAIATKTEQQIHDEIAAAINALAGAQHRVGGAIASDTITDAEMQAGLHAFLNPASGNTPTAYEAAVANAIVNGGAIPPRPSTASLFGLTDAQYQSIRATGLSDADIQQLSDKDRMGMDGGLQDYLSHVSQLAVQDAREADIAAQQAFVPTTADQWWSKWGHGPRFYTVNGTTGDLFVQDYPNFDHDHSAVMDAEYQKARTAQDARTAAQINVVMPAPPAPVSTPAPISRPASSPTPSTPTSTPAPPVVTSNTSGQPTPIGPSASSNYPMVFTPPTMPSDVAAIDQPIPQQTFAPATTATAAGSSGISSGWLIAGGVGLGIAALLFGSRRR